VPTFGGTPAPVTGQQGKESLLDPFLQRRDDLLGQSLLEMLNWDFCWYSPPLATANRILIRPCAVSSGPSPVAEDDQGALAEISLSSSLTVSMPSLRMSSVIGV
jgi:hypothetical protein